MKAVIFVYALAALAIGVFWASIGLVAWHFIAKFW